MRHSRSTRGTRAAKAKRAKSFADTQRKAAKVVRELHKQAVPAYDVWQ